MSTFTEQIGYLIGDVSAYADEIAQALDDGVEDVIQKVLRLRPDLGQLFSEEISIGNDTGIPLSFTFPLVDAERNGKRCCVGIARLANEYVNSSSIYYATDASPIVYIRNSRAFIKPSPAAVAQGTINRVVKGSVTDATPAIASFPEDMYRIVVLFAAAKVCLAKTNNERAKFPIDMEATSAFTLIADMSTAGVTVSYDLATELAALKAYINTDEDVELAAAKVAEITSKLGTMRSEVQDMLADQSGDAAVFNVNLQKNLSLFSTKLQKHVATIGSLLERYKVLLGEYQSAFDGLGGGK